MCYPQWKGRERGAVPAAGSLGRPEIHIGTAGVLENNNQGTH